jgi:peptidyl-prolyl cis-trans isomerase SurA
MNKRALSAFLTLILSISTSPFLAIAQEKKEVLVVVGTISIDKEEFLQLLSKERESESPANSLTRKEFEENFESFLTYKLKVIEAESIKLDQLEEFNLEFSSIKESLIAPYLIKNSIHDRRNFFNYELKNNIPNYRHTRSNCPKRVPPPPQLCWLLHRPAPLRGR